MQSSAKSQRELNKLASKKAVQAMQLPMHRPQDAPRAPSHVPRQIIDTAVPDLPVIVEPPVYERVGRLTGGYSLKPQPLFAVVELSGTQFKVRRAYGGVHV
jgi:hypothetical protein